MIEEASTLEPPGALPDDAFGVRRGQALLRVRLATRDPRAWAQLVRFGLVGASGYVVNLLVFAALVQGAGADHRGAAAVAFAVALTNNFVWNRRWTFRATEGHAGFQAARFLTVSLAAFLISLVVLEALVSIAGLAALPAQALAIVVATPFNFIGNRLWSFRH